MPGNMLSTRTTPVVARSEYLLRKYGFLYVSTVCIYVSILGLIGVGGANRYYTIINKIMKASSQLQQQPCSFPDKTTTCPDFKLVTSFPDYDLSNCDYDQSKLSFPGK